MKVNNKRVSSELFPPFAAGTYTPLSKWVCIQADKVEKLKGRKLILGGGQGNTYLALLAAGWPCVQGVDVFGSLICLRLEAENAGFPGLVLISLHFPLSGEPLRLIYSKTPANNYHFMHFNTKS